MDMGRDGGPEGARHHGYGAGWGARGGFIPMDMRGMRVLEGGSAPQIRGRMGAAQPHVYGEDRGLLGGSAPWLWGRMVVPVRGAQPHSYGVG